MPPALRKPKGDSDRESTLEELVLDHRALTHEMLMKLNQHEKNILLQREALERGDLAAALALNGLLQEEVQKLGELAQRVQHNHAGQTSMVEFRPRPRAWRPGERDVR